MVDPYDPEELLVCPYDPVHRIARKRIQAHIIKCRKNYNTKSFAVCPFNAKHVMPKPELSYHISTCDDRSRVEIDISHSSSVYKAKGNTSVPVHDWKPPSPEEDSWDDDNVKYVPKQAEEIFDKQNPIPVHHVPVTPPRDKDNTATTTTTTTAGVYQAPVVRIPSQVDSQFMVYKYSIAGGRGRARSFDSGGLTSAGRGRGIPGLGRGGPTRQDPATAVLRGLQNNQHYHSSHQYQALPTTNQYPTESEVVDGHDPTSTDSTTTTTTTTTTTATTAAAAAEIDVLRKNVRKLNKMLKQIHQIEDKQLQGAQLQVEQEAKLKRKGDVERSLSICMEKLRIAEQSQQ